jgi:hypothetical protein
MLGVWVFVAPGGEQRVKPSAQLLSAAEAVMNVANIRTRPVVNMMPVVIVL